MLWVWNKLTGLISLFLSLGSAKVVIEDSKRPSLHNVLKITQPHLNDLWYTDEALLQIATTQHS